MPFYIYTTQTEHRFFSRLIYNAVTEFIDGLRVQGACSCVCMCAGVGVCVLSS